MHFADALGDLGQRAVDALHRVHRSADIGLGHGQLVAGKLRFFLGAHGQRADQIGDDRETATRLASTACFDGGVHGENAGLEGDLVEPFDDRVDALGAFADASHRLNRLIGDRSPATDRLDRVVCAYDGLLTGICGHLEALVDLGQRGGGFFQAGRVAFGTTGKIFRCLRNLARARADRLGTVGDRRNHLALACNCLVEVGFEFPVRRREVGLQFRGQIAFGERSKPSAQCGRHHPLFLGFTNGVFRAFGCGHAETVHGLGDLADFVRAIGGRHRKVSSTGQTLGRIGQRRERAGDAPVQAKPDCA